MKTRNPRIKTCPKNPNAINVKPFMYKYTYLVDKDYIPQFSMEVYYKAFFAIFLMFSRLKSTKIPKPKTAINDLFLETFKALLEMSYSCQTIGPFH